MSSEDLWEKAREKVVKNTGPEDASDDFVETVVLRYFLNGGEWPE